MILWQSQAGRKYPQASGVSATMTMLRWVVNGTSATGAAVLMGMERATFTRLFGRIFGRVN